MVDQGVATDDLDQSQKQTWCIDQQHSGSESRLVIAARTLLDEGWHHFGPFTTGTCSGYNAGSKIPLTKSRPHIRHCQGDASKCYARRESFFASR